MKDFNDYIEKIENPTQKIRLKEILDWISSKYPFLEKKIAWNQPHFVHEGTFILGLSYSKAHVAIAPEHVTLIKFKELAEKNHYETTDNIIKIKWTQTVDYDYLAQMIDFNLNDKLGYKTYWR